MIKSVIIFFISSLSFLISVAQTPTELLKQRQEKMMQERKEYNEGLVDTSHRYFYVSYEDYISHKPYTNVKYTGKRKVVVGSESVLVLDNDEFDYKKVKDLKYWGFIDEYGQLERIFENHCYYVLDSGKICLYIKAMDVEMRTDKNGNVSLLPLMENSTYKEYLSQGLKGDIEDFSDKKFQSMTQPDIYQQYLQEPESAAKDKRIQKTFKIQKYIHLYNKE
jgi:hypothetical protein